MILARLTRAIREQNWFAVGIEFVIVILGVVIGFQITAWNAARAERLTERRALELLLGEAQNNVAYSELIIYRAGRLQADREAAAARLAGDTVRAGDGAHGLQVMSVYRDMTPIRAAHDQLTASGAITTIRSAQVREALSLFEGVVVFHDRARGEYMARTPDIAALASPYLTTRYAPEVPGSYTLDVDWAAAGSDRQLVNAIHRVLGEQAEFDSRRQIILDRARILCEALALELESTCTPPDWLGGEIAAERDAAE